MYCLYLRKSRADADAELRGEGETLARHEKQLLTLAKSMNLPISNIYREIVSGETIASRPVMQQLLSEVEQGIYKGVLVVEVERLARGDTIDQGIVSQAFKFSQTKIITPMKIYDPNNEFDEEYFEFGLFMSRREYKAINRRLQSGRLSSVKEGKYVGNKPPYGYDRVKIENDKGFTLIPNESESEIVKLIFKLYTCDDRLGVALIVRRLNELGIKPRYNEFWVTGTVQDILKNPVYIGKLKWNSRKQVKTVINGEIVKSRPRAKEENITYTKGLHEPLIDEITWEKAKYYMNKNPRPPVVQNKKLSNPLASLIVCKKCGRKMVMRPYSKPGTKPTIICPITACNNVSSKLEHIEKSILHELNITVINLETEINKKEKVKEVNLEEKIIKNLNKELSKLKVQSENLYDLLEQGIYTHEVFINRSKAIGERISIIEESIRNTEKELKNKTNQISTEKFIPQLKNVIKMYPLVESVELKNTLLKSVIQKVVYEKNKKGTRRKDNMEMEFTIEVILKR